MKMRWLPDDENCLHFKENEFFKFEFDWAGKTVYVPFPINLDCLPIEMTTLSLNEYDRKIRKHFTAI